MSNKPLKRGFALCVVGPSGTGKTSLCDKLAVELDDCVRSISMTTRKKRPAERSGQDYIFVEQEEFQRLKESNELLEYAEVFGNEYATPAAPVREAIAKGQVIVMDIDTVGAHYLSQRLKNDCVRVFVSPPSIEELQRRLEQRKQNTPEDLERRLKEARREIEEGKTYPHQIVNDNFDEAYAKLVAIIRQEREKIAL